MGTCTLLWNGHTVTAVHIFPFGVNTAEKNAYLKDLHCAIVLNSISFQASVWMCQNELLCTFIFEIRSKLRQSTTCLVFVFLFFFISHNSGSNSDSVWTSQSWMQTDPLRDECLLKDLSTMAAWGPCLSSDHHVWELHNESALMGEKYRLNHIPHSFTCLTWIKGPSVCNYINSKRQIVTFFFTVVLGNNYFNIWLFISVFSIHH